MIEYPAIVQVLDQPGSSEAAAATGVPSEPAPSVAPESAAPVPVKPAYPPPAPLPTQEGPQGLRFDFNDGCRVVLPEGPEPWRVRLSDLDTGNILYETRIKAGRVNSSKRYFVPIRLEVWAGEEPVLTHDYAALGREVLIQFPVGTLGDTLGWFPYAVKFERTASAAVSPARWPSG